MFLNYHRLCDSPLSDDLGQNRILSYKICSWYIKVYVQLWVVQEKISK